MRQILLSIFVLLASTVFAYAQKPYDGCADVKGISRETKCDYAKFVSVFGVPDYYRKVGVPEDGDEMSEVYYFGETYFVFQNNGELRQFFIRDSRFPVLTNYIKGGIRVGDKFSVFEKFEYSKPILKETRDDGTEKYVLWEDSYDPMYFYVINGSIKTIRYAAIP